MTRSLNKTGGGGGGSERELSMPQMSSSSSSSSDSSLTSSDFRKGKKKKTKRTKKNRDGGRGHHHHPETVSVTAGSIYHQKQQQHHHHHHHQERSYPAAPPTTPIVTGMGAGCDAVRPAPSLALIQDGYVVYARVGDMPLVCYSYPSTDAPKVLEIGSGDMVALVYPDFVAASRERWVRLRNVVVESGNVYDAWVIRVDVHNRNNFVSYSMLPI